MSKIKWPEHLTRPTCALMTCSDWSETSNGHGIIAYAGKTHRITVENEETRGVVGDKIKVLVEVLRLTIRPFSGLSGFVLKSPDDIERWGLVRVPGKVEAQRATDAWEPFGTSVIWVPELLLESTEERS